jgi:hypothetical protein
VHQLHLSSAGCNIGRAHRCFAIAVSGMRAHVFSNGEFVDSVETVLSSVLFGGQFAKGVHDYARIAVFERRAAGSLPVPPLLVMYDDIVVVEAPASTGSVVGAQTGKPSAPSSSHTSSTRSAPTSPLSKPGGVVGEGARASWLRADTAVDAHLAPGDAGGTLSVTTPTSASTSAHNAASTSDAATASETVIASSRMSTTMRYVCESLEILTFS